MGVVLRELAHAEQAVQGAGLFVAVHHTEFEKAHGQVAVAVQGLVVHEHMAHAVHGLHAMHVFLDLREVHVFTVVGVVAGAFPQFAAQDLRAAHEFVAALQMFADEEVFEHGAQHHALGQPEGHAGGDVFMEGEQAQFLAEAAMVAALGFFECVQVFLEGLFVAEGRTIDAGQHGALLVAAPVSASHGEQFEGLHSAGAGDMRAAAEVEEVAAAVQGHGVGFEFFDDLDLVDLALAGEEGHGFGLAHDGALEGNVGGHDGAHFLLDGFEVFRGEGAGSVEVVVEALVDGRADGHLHAGEELLHGGGHDMGGGMAQELQAFGLVSGDGGGFNSVGGHFSGEIEESFSFSSLHTAGKSGLEPFAGKSLLQHVGTGSAEGGLDRLSFYGYLHDKTPENKKRKGRRCLPFRFCFVVGTSRLELLTPSVSRKCSAT